MSDEVIPEDVKRFVLTSIASVPHLEALLLVHAAADREWSAASIARRLYISEPAASELLVQLCEAEFLTVTGQSGPVYRYHPGTPEQARIVDRLAASYTTHLVGITNLIHSKAGTRVQQFADAFKLRKGS